MPDTFFTSSPHWAWYITFYFFIGGIAGGAFFLSAVLQLFGRREDRPLVRTGYLVALIGAILSGLLLTLDLRRPERFWHMLVEANTGVPMFKSYSPMSVGAWGLLFFSLFAFLAVLGLLADDGRLPRLLSAFARGPVGIVVAALGSFFALFLASYTGVLLSVSNRPLWADTNFLGALFLFSAASTAAASLILITRWRGIDAPESLDWLARVDRGALILELVVLIVLVASLGSAARVLGGVWGALLLVGVVGAGILVPLALGGRHGGAVMSGRGLTAASLVVAGGFLLRFVVIFSSEGIRAIGSGVAFH